MTRYRHAHWWILALLPLIAVAFWPGYFSRIGSSTLARHVHGVAGTTWIMLAAAQSWSIATRRHALHRTLGLAVFAAVPLFVAGGTLALAAMATGAVTGDDPFNARFGARLAAVDLTSVIAMPLLVRDALTHRRQVARHAASMLATVLLVLPPVLARLAPIIPGFPPDFVLACNTGQLVAAAIGVMLWLRDRRFGGAFLAVAALQATQSAIFALYGGTMIARALATPPPLALATIAALATLAMLWLAWRPLRPLARPAAAV